MKKIIFNDKYGLTAAVLQGCKTMMRRVLDYEKYKKTWDDMCRLGTPCYDTFDDFLTKRASLYQVGEVVAVAQRGIDIYHALQRRYGETSDASLGFMEMYKGLPMWNNKLSVPTDLCPSRICITNIKVERLQDISDIDCAKEGVRYFLDYSQEKIARFYIDAIPNYHPGAMITYDSVKDAFAVLIDKVSGNGTWESNPWVFAYSFELCE